MSTNIEVVYIYMVYDQFLICFLITTLSLLMPQDQSNQASSKAGSKNAYFKKFNVITS